MELYVKALELHAAGLRFALASVVHALGSTPQKAGAHALFEVSGAVHGTLGGGCLEAEVRRRALDALDNAVPLLFDLHLDAVEGWDDGLVCGGRVQVFIQPDLTPHLTTVRRALDALAARRRGLLVTVLSPSHPQQGCVHWLEEQERNTATGLAAREELWTMLHSDTASRLTLPGESSQDLVVFVEPVAPPPRLIIAGAGHIGKAISHLGTILGFEVTVVDDRALFASAENLPDAKHVVCGPIAETLETLRLGPEDYVVIVTRGHKNDGAALAACIHAPAAYLGLIGSKRKSLLLRRRLIEEGLASEEEVARVVSPIGLDIGAKTVPEIALSIAAQLVAVRRKGGLTVAPLTLPV